MCKVNSDYPANVANYLSLNSRNQREKASILQPSLGYAYTFVLQSLVRLFERIMIPSDKIIFDQKKCLFISMSHKRTHSTKSAAFCLPACHVPQVLLCWAISLSTALGFSDNY